MHVGHADILKDVTEAEERTDVLMMRAYGAVVAKGKTKAGLKWLVKLYKQTGTLRLGLLGYCVTPCELALELASALTPALPRLDGAEITEDIIKAALVARLDDDAWVRL